jgi:hypothetical protein
MHVKETLTSGAGAMMRIKSLMKSATESRKQRETKDLKAMD